MSDYKYRAKDVHDDGQPSDGGSHEHRINPTGPAYPIGHSANKPALIQPKQEHDEKEQQD